ncbi:transcription factor EMB1444-like [Pyrus communis]|uniref:transcription factor EMB1444-like n=1 Tax=Pyrus communis TaxID=23211 RepID=UPI0035C08483
MGTTALRQLLKNLCSNSPWNYAVFWKLKHQSDLILSWEDGYCHHPKPIEAVEHASDDIYFSNANQMLFKGFATSIHDGGSTGYPIGLAVADMSYLQHTFGKGVVGEVACTGNYSWVFLNNLCTRESGSKLVPECPDEWILQFSSGIKTILLVPVLPYGVLQLGSLETVAEDPTVVAFVKDRFNDIHNGMGKIVPYSQAQSSWSQSSNLMETTFEPSGVTINPLKVEKSEDVDNIRYNNLLSTLGHLLPTAEDSLLETGTDHPEVLKSRDESVTGVPPIYHSGESSPLSQSIDTSLLGMMESQMFGLSCLEEELLAYSQFGGYNLEVFGESMSDFTSYPVGGVAELFEDVNAKDTSYSMVNNFFSFPENCELHKALGTLSQRQTDENLWDPSIGIDDTCSSSSLQKDLASSIEPSWFSKGSDAENLVKAFVAKDETSSSRSDNIKSSITSSSQFPASFKQLKFEACAPIESGSVTWNQSSSLLARGATPASFTDMMSTLVDEEQQGKGYKSVKPKREQKLSGGTARKTKIGNSPKLRPRDRQLIQDRVKELRELVPNGAKCSIDGLLDRTIKHMQFLRNMTDQAEKLKCYTQQEAPRSNTMSEATSGCENGTSRAFEVGSEHQICPIVVEDLEHSGHILIEMLCDEHGLFLDIAQAIRRLELTILKGVMETRLSNMWAHFVVEAPLGFHRMDVFWPLLHLLQRRRSSISSRI